MENEFLPPLKKKTKNPRTESIHCDVCRNVDMFIGVLATALILLTV